MADLSSAVGQYMRFTGLFGRVSAVLVALTVCAGAPVATAPAHASTPAPIWQDVARVNVLCLVQTDAGVDTGALHGRICNSVTLLVQASVRSGLLAFSIRPYRNSGAPMLFTAAPRAVPLAAPAGQSKEFEAALGAALSETLPWLSRPVGARPIR
jgi:hypothetical protein